MSNLPPAQQGWYPVPGAPGEMAYFDGSRWTWRGRPDANGRWTQEPIITPAPPAASVQPPGAGSPGGGWSTLTPAFLGPAMSAPAPRWPSRSVEPPVGRLDLFVPPPVRQARWKTLLRAVLVLPSAVALNALWVAAEVLSVLMWFVALVTARVPDSMWRFNVGVLRFQARTSAYVFLLTDAYPPFSVDEPPYPVRMTLDGPPARLNRLAVLFRAILAIPAALVTDLLMIGLVPFVVVAWLATLVSGRNPRVLHQSFSAALRFFLRYNAWFLLLTDVYPKALFGDDPMWGPQGPGTLVVTRGGRWVTGVAITLGALVYVAEFLVPAALVQIQPAATPLTRFDMASLVNTSEAAELQYDNSLSTCDTSMACGQRASSTLDQAVISQIGRIEYVDFPTGQQRSAATRLSELMQSERSTLQRATITTTASAYAQDLERAQADEIAVVSGLRSLGAAVGAVSTALPTTTSVGLESASGPAVVQAAAIGLQPQDLGSDFTATIPGGETTQHSRPSHCTPLSSSPWLAFVQSPQYSTASTSLIVFTTVVVLPRAGQAQRALQAVSAPTYGQDCFQPAFDANYRASESAVNAATPCDISVGSSSIAAVPAGSAGAGVSGWTYQTSFHCHAEDTTSAVYQVILSEVVGKVFIQANLRSLVDPPAPSFEAQVMAEMAARAESMASTSPTALAPAGPATAVASSITR